MNALQQFLQAASNAAAETVSGPVDLIGMGLRKLGVPVPENALMSSGWMRQNALMRDVPQTAASLAGETFGLISPIAAAAKAPQIAGGLLKMGENAAAPRTLNPQTGAIVWHGSPHKFDRFDASKIGTGEGAQAYGHGLYLAEAPDVAKSYSGKLSSELKYNGRPMARESGRNSRDAAAWALYLAEGDKATAKASGLAKPELIDALDPAKLQPGGQLYKVDLPDSAIARMLDWDKPLSQQAGVMKTLEEANQVGFGLSPSPAMTGEQLYRVMQRRNAAYSDIGSRGGADDLRWLGIPGIRYLDGGSRGAGAGTSNFVVFPGEENILRILERNGVPLGK